MRLITVLWLCLAGLAAACTRAGTDVALLSPGSGADNAGSSARERPDDAGARPAPPSQSDAGQLTTPAAQLRDASREAEPQDAGTMQPQPDAGRDATVRDASAGDPELDAGTDEPSCSGPPGLYQDTECRVPSAELLAFLPQYPLWSDGASKERFIYLPPGSHIDTSNPDRWSFPVGTRVYKTFALGALKIETRLLEKVAEAPSYSSWTAVAYAWSRDQRSVSLADPNGVMHALGTALDIPAQGHCLSCHSMNAADAVIGFNAIQLNHPDAGVTLASLLERGWLVDVAGGNGVNITLEGAQIPGDATTKAALGYLHGNCGHCHGGPNPRANQRLWSLVGVTALSAEPIFQSAVCQCLVSWTGRKASDSAAFELRVRPQHAAWSGIVGRMNATAVGERMPPIGTKQVDVEGLRAVQAWIDSLDPSACDALPPTCP